MVSPETAGTVPPVGLFDVVPGEFSENAIRKDCLPSEAVAIKRALETEEREAAKERQVAGKRLPKLGKGRSADKVAAFTGMERKILRARWGFHLFQLILGNELTR